MPAIVVANPKGGVGKSTLATKLARGLNLWDVAPGRVERDLPQWDSILRWVQQ